MEKLQNGEPQKNEKTHQKFILPTFEKGNTGDQNVVA